MKTTTSVLTLLICFIILLSCKKDPAMPAMPALKFYDGKGILSVGQTGMFYTSSDSMPLEIKFIKVTGDSRCPEGAVCVWAGEIVAEILVNKTNTFLTASIVSPQKPVYNGKYITILSALPYPNVRTAINPKDYKVEFKVEK